MTAQLFVLEIGRAMHALGSPSYRVEDAMDACCRAFGLQGSFFSTPTAIFAAMGQVGEEPRTTLLRVVPGDHDLGRLSALYGIRDDVLSGRRSPTEGLERVRAILHMPPRRQPLVDVLAYGLSGAAVAVLFSGGVAEVGLAGAAGLLSGTIAAVSRLRPGLGDVQTPLACALVAFLVHLVAGSGIAIDPLTTTVAAIVVFLPGLSFTTALAELSMRHLAAGSARLLGTVAVLLTMAIGVGIGERAARALVGWPSTAPVGGLDWPWHLAALLGIGCSYVILLRATTRQIGWVAVAVAVGYLGARAGGVLLERELGAFVGALGVALVANFYARWRRQPAAVVRTPGLLLLVPGSLGFRGFTLALDKSAESVQFVFQMLLVGGAIVAGLLMAGVLLPPTLDGERDGPHRSLAS
ncbi:MAG: threonine/serine exporter family protein [Planctomycetes bacterium]|nr:threonine/serine exporter family protein [Planctomycetota bacterium]